MDHDVGASFFRVLWPPHHNRPLGAEATLVRELAARDQLEAEQYEAAVDRGERTWDQRN